MKKKIAVGIVALAVVVAAPACSTERSKSSSTKVDTLNTTVGPAQPNFTRNFNTFSPASKKSPAINYFYEPMVRVDRTDSNKIKPWLAKSADYSDGGKTLTFKLRDDLKWSDGKPLTSADVKYTLELPSKKKGLGSAPIPHLRSVTTPDRHTAVVHYSKPELHDLTNYSSSPRLIVPKHVWKKHDPKKWTNKNPIGTGPFSLKSFGTQSIKLTWRKKYWGGDTDGVKHVNIKAFGSEDSGRQMVLKNKVSWSGMAWKNYKSDFVKQDPKNNHYWTYPTGGSTGPVFNVKKAPTDNVHIRRALYAALDGKKLLKLYNSGVKAANPVGLEQEIWKDYLPKNLRNKRHKENFKKARAELKASGYHVKHGKLTKKGKSYPLSLKTNADYGSWTAYAPGMRSQWKDALGINVSIKKSPTDQLAEYQEDGDFQMLFDYLVGGDDIWSGLDSQLSSKYMKPLGKRANGNYGRYSNAKVDRLLERMGGTRDKTALQKSTAKLAKIVARDVPYAPIHTSASYIEANSTDWGGWPDREHAKYLPHSQEPVDAILAIKHLKPKTSK